MAADDERAALALHVGIDGLCALFSVERKTIGEWVRLGMPKAARGKYRLADCIQWRRQRDMQSARGGDGDLNEERRLLIVEQRRSHELDNAAKAAELLPADEVATDMMALATIFAGQLDALPPRVAHRLVAITDPTVIQRVLRDECRSIRRAAGEAIAAYGDDLGGGEDHDAAARPKRRRMGRRPPDAAAGEPGAGAVAD